MLLQRAEEAGACVIEERWEGAPEHTATALYVCPVVPTEQAPVLAVVDLCPAVSWLRTALLEPIAQRHGVRVRTRQGCATVRPCKWGFHCWVTGCKFAHPHGRLIDDDRPSLSDASQVLVGHLVSPPTNVAAAVAAATEKLGKLWRCQLVAPRRPHDAEPLAALEEHANDLTDRSVLVRVLPRDDEVVVEVTALYRCRESFDEACQQLTSMMDSWGSDMVPPVVRLAHDALGSAASDDGVEQTAVASATVAAAAASRQGGEEGERL